MENRVEKLERGGLRVCVCPAWRTHPPGASRHLCSLRDASNCMQHIPVRVWQAVGGRERECATGRQVPKYVPIAYSGIWRRGPLLV
eukprot:8799291-Prorocentrum_lima.AAC.1